MLRNIQITVDDEIILTSLNYLSKNGNDDELARLYYRFPNLVNTHLPDIIDQCRSAKTRHLEMLNSIHHHLFCIYKKDHEYMFSYELNSNYPEVYCLQELSWTF